MQFNFRLKNAQGYCLMFLWLILSASPAYPIQTKTYDVKFIPKLQRAYFEIQKLRLQTARALIEEERNSNADNALIPYLDNYADLHYLLISEDKTAYKKLSEKEEQRLSAIDELADNSPYKRFFQAEIRMHWAFAKMKFGNEVSGAWDIIKAYRLLDENRKKFPAFSPTLKSLGLLHVLIGSVPENYTWVTKILGLKGNIPLGVQEIQTVIREEPFFQQEAQLIDLLLHAYTLQLSNAQRAKIKQLPKDQPDNLLLHFFATTILIKEGNSREASSYLNEAPQGNAYIPFPFLNYLKGEIALQQGKYDSAFSWYALFQKNYKGFNYIKDSNLKLFMCRWLANRDGEAIPFIRRLQNTGSEIIEADKLAQRTAAEFLAGKIQVQQKVLYRSRYATDGGYLDKALEELESVSEKSFSNVSDKSEFNYRKGRILQKSENMEGCIPYFERAVALTKNTSIGFGASSALQLGYIFRDRKQKDKAVSSFKTAMSYKKYEYKNSIDNKARAALSELGQ
ncbi:hypothetical protein [Dyadobacter psychrotolerans]|uniref:Uncharacterized protein n=1 Tax=Dyadobacter psychrotolerans TaxID=2541721 RepID=A0A4R5DPA1_9BACT|nr:hypothetical protein [Dyadobacter psychrotolerans]TDE16172.1 hypothetical protein E0F88_07925 [Dyadobacter psychrotolerans]